MLSSVFCLNVLDYGKEPKSEEYFYTGDFLLELQSIGLHACF